MLDRTIPTDRGPRPTPEQIKKWYQEVAVLLNRIEGSGERLRLAGGADGNEIQGQTARIQSTDEPGTWSWQ